MQPTKILIMGAAGRDFHNFNLLYRNKEQYQVVAFTATQKTLVFEMLGAFEGGTFDWFHL